MQELNYKHTPNTFPIRNLIPKPSNQLVSHTLCIRGYLVRKYVSFTQTFVCLVKKTGESDLFKIRFQNKIPFLSKRKDRRNRRPRGRARRKNAGSHSGDSAGDHFLRGLDSKPN